MHNIAAIFKRRNPDYTYNASLAVAMWLGYLSKYTDDRTNVKTIRSILDKDVSIIEDVFRDTEIIQLAFFKDPDNIIKTPVVNVDNLIVSSDKLGSGAFGVVFAGKLDGKDVAVKSYAYIESRHATRQYSDWCSCMKEYALLCKLQGSGIVGELYGAGWNGGCWRMIIQCHSIRSIDWKRHELRTTENTKQIVCDLFNAIAQIHALTGYIHGDIKPVNVMIDIKENKPVVKIIDFGLSEPVGILEKNHQYVQSIFWRSPELLDEKPCDLIEADIWATTITAFDIMAGRCIMYEIGAVADISVVDMSNLLVCKCLGRTTIPDEWKTYINEELIDFANELYAKYIIGGT